MDRRKFLSLGGALTGGAIASAVPGKARASSHGAKEPDPDAMGVLVDVTRCIGCRMCEEACAEANGLPPPDSPFSDSVFEQHRLTDTEHFTVVNRYPAADGGSPITVKTQCMHCVDPVCVSACIFAALEKHPEGPVTWNPYKCIGCRYCEFSCPFEIPRFHWDRALTPQIRKCTMCYDREGGPACAEACPTDALIYGKRSELLELAHRRIAEHPDRYVNHVYGEHEAGGTSWLYLAPQDFETLGMVADLPERSPARVSEGIQHGIFKYGIAPVGLYASLGALMFLTHRKEEVARSDSHGSEGGER